MPAQNKQKSKNKLTLQLVSVLIAISLWLIISYSEDPVIDVTLSNIEIEYRGIDKLEEKGLTISDANNSPNFAISVSGKRSDLIQVIQKAKAYIDVSSITSPDTYNLAIKTELPTNSVTIKKQKLKNLDVKIESIVEKDIPIVVKQTDKNKNYLIKTSAEQETIHISGSKTLLSSASYAMVEVSVANMSSDNTQDCSYTIMTANNDPVNHQENIFSDTKNIQVHSKVYTPKIMHIKLNIPEKVASQYDIDLLQMPTISVGIKNGAPDYVYADFPDETPIPSESTDYELTLKDNEYIYIEEGKKDVTVCVKITKKELQHVQPKIILQNTGSEYTATCDASAMDVYVNCIPETFTPSSLVAYADLSGLKEGTHEVDLTFNNQKDVTIIGDYKVDVTISKK